MMLLFHLMSSGDSSWKFCNNMNKRNRASFTDNLQQRFIKTSLGLSVSSAAHAELCPSAQSPVTKKEKQAANLNKQNSGQKNSITASSDTVKPVRGRDPLPHVIAVLLNVYKAPLVLQGRWLTSKTNQRGLDMTSPHTVRHCPVLINRVIVEEGPLCCVVKKKKGGQIKQNFLLLLFPFTEVILLLLTVSSFCNPLITLRLLHPWLASLVKPTRSWQ